MKKSAGILAFRRTKSLEIFLVHPGGPFWRTKDTGAWSIPKGELDDGEEPLAAAKREFVEETGQPIEGDFISLKMVTLKSGKKIIAWAVEANPDASQLVSNTISLEFPYKSGKWQHYPEVDRASWFTPEEATLKMNPAQAVWIEELLAFLRIPRESK